MVINLSTEYSVQDKPRYFFYELYDLKARVHTGIMPFANPVDAERYFIKFCRDYQFGNCGEFDFKLSAVGFSSEGSGRTILVDPFCLPTAFFDEYPNVVVYHGEDYKEVLHV